MREQARQPRPQPGHIKQALLNGRFVVSFTAVHPLLCVPVPVRTRYE